MKLIVGLGNPGQKYVNNRHNAGFLVVDDLLDRYGGTSFLGHKKFDAHMASGTIEGRQVIYAKPQTYMNKSGDSVSKIASFYDIDVADILVVHDDIDIHNQTHKLKYAGSHGGQNGVRDIINRLGSSDFRRLKCGVGRPSHPAHDVADYVLSNFSEDDMLFRHTETRELATKVEQWLKNVG